jgi:geranylgeranyl diphosphate synthase type I
MIAWHMAWQSWDDRSEAVPNAGGKKVRPLLALLAAQALAGDYRKAMPAALAVQIVHDFSIVLDDIMDQDHIRRGRPTLWVRDGINRAMTAATGLYIVGLDALQDYPALGVAPAQLRRLTRILFSCCLEMHDAQFIDLNWERQFDMTLDEVKQVALGRSALIKCGAEVGAAVASEDEEVQAALSAYGALLATAYSIYDDQRGLWGVEADNGKPLCSDIRQRKKTYPIVAGHLRAGDAGRQRMIELFASPEIGNAEIDAVLTILDETGASALTLDEVARLGGQALDCLDRPALAGFDMSPFVEVTHALLDGHVARRAAAEPWLGT